MEDFITVKNGRKNKKNWRVYGEKDNCNYMLGTITSKGNAYLFAKELAKHNLYKNITIL